VQVTEYFHPRAAEACSILPASLGAWIEARPRVVAWLGRRVDKGRRLRTDTLRGWLSLWLVAGLKPVRRRLLRHRVERAHLEQWLNRALRAGAADHALGVEVLRCRRLIKGYSDTHARGLSKYAKIMDALDMLQGRGDAAEWLARLRQAALRDEKGDELAGALQTIESFRDTAGAKAG
jgi:indolepyruvate ferredoxin oxidoreductase, beta subunit